MGTKRWQILLVAFFVTLVAGVSWLGCALFLWMDDRHRDAYAGWTVAELTIDFMESHDGGWPNEWEDLRQSLAARTGNEEVTIEDLRQRVEVDWAANPKRLAKESLPVRVIWLRSGRSAYWKGREPNQMIFEYLQARGTWTPKQE
jgi:hypothetical protein